MFSPFELDSDEDRGKDGDKPDDLDHTDHTRLIEIRAQMEGVADGNESFRCQTRNCENRDVREPSDKNA